MSRVVLALGVCLALVIGGCGGSGDTTSSTVSTGETTPTTARAEGKGAPAQDAKGGNHSPSKSSSKSKGSSPKGEGSKQQGNGDDSPSAPSPERYLAQVKAPAISSRPIAGSRRPAPGVKTVEGGDNSVQEYGVEAGSSERTAAAIALQGYLNAKAREDWAIACSLLAKKPMEQLERIQRAAARQGQQLDGCAQTMALLKEGRAESLQQAEITEVLSFRGGGDISGDPSYLLFTAPPGDTLFSMPMYSEGGVWKVGLARPSELPVG